jgi:hypothetical protein
MSWQMLNVLQASLASQNIMFMDEYKIGNASGIEVLLGQNNLLLGKLNQA